MDSLINNPGIYLRNQDALTIALTLQQKFVQVAFSWFYFCGDHNYIFGFFLPNKEKQK